MKNLAFECRTCGERFENPGSGKLSNHNKTHHPDPPSGTEQEKFEQHKQQLRYILQKGIEKNRQSEVPSADCNSVGKDSALEIQRRVVACLLNSTKTANVEKLLENSDSKKETDSKEKPIILLQCKKCGIKLSSFQAANQHYLSHNSVDPSASPEGIRPLKATAVDSPTAPAVHDQENVKAESEEKLEVRVETNRKVAAVELCCGDFIGTGHKNNDVLGSTLVKPSEDLIGFTNSTQMADVNMSPEKQETDTTPPSSQQSCNTLNDSFALLIDEERQNDADCDDLASPDEPSTVTSPPDIQNQTEKSDIIVISDSDEEAPNKSGLTDSVPLAYTLSEMINTAKNVRKPSTSAAEETDHKTFLKISNCQSEDAEKREEKEAVSTSVPNNSEKDQSNAIPITENSHQSPPSDALLSHFQHHSREKFEQQSSVSEGNEMIHDGAETEGFSPLAYSFNELVIAAQGTENKEQEHKKTRKTKTQERVSHEGVKIISVASLDPRRSVNQKTQDDLAIETELSPTAAEDIINSSNLPNKSSKTDNGGETENAKRPGNVTMENESTDSATESTLAARQRNQGPLPHVDDFAPKQTTKSCKNGRKKSKENSAKQKQHKGKQGRKKKPRLIESTSDSDSDEPERYSKKVNNITESTLQDSPWIDLYWNSTKDASKPEQAEPSTSDVMSGNTDLSESSSDEETSVTSGSEESDFELEDFRKIIHTPFDVTNRPHEVTHRKVSKESSTQSPILNANVTHRKSSGESVCDGLVKAASPSRERAAEVCNKPLRTNCLKNNKDTSSSSNNQRMKVTQRKSSKESPIDKTLKELSSTSAGSELANRPSKIKHRNTSIESASDGTASGKLSNKPKKSVRRKTSKETVPHLTSKENALSSELSNQPQRKKSKELLSSTSQTQPTLTETENSTRPNEEIAESITPDTSSLSSTEVHTSAKELVEPCEPDAFFIPKKRVTARKSIRSSNNPMPMQPCVRCGKLIYFDQKIWMLHYETECTGKK